MVSKFISNEVNVNHCGVQKDREDLRVQVHNEVWEENLESMSEVNACMKHIDTVQNTSKHLSNWRSFPSMHQIMNRTLIHLIHCAHVKLYSWSVGYLTVYSKREGVALHYNPWCWFTFSLLEPVNQIFQMWKREFWTLSEWIIINISHLDIHNFST